MAFRRFDAFVFAPSRQSHDPTRIHPALTSFADEACATLARLFAYVGALGLLGIVGVHFFDPWSAAWGAAEPPVRAGWSAASRSYQAFAVRPLDPSEKTETYSILRHPQGGRKDVFRWAGKDEKPVAELEIYRPGGEFYSSISAVADLAARMTPSGASELEPAGLVDSKFGMVTLLRRAGETDGAPSCLGFTRRFEAPDLQVSGWSCRGNGWPAQRVAIACTLNRLILLTSGNEPKLAKMFARAELRRGGCGAATATTASADWVTAAANPGLRGAF
ncbi:MAG: hypothetical protein E6G85_31295 [Alphaproteobacteria bacterium]|nr:MAG: hypothetical protein E6G85_31295 [Alphaproteobacteria bacterium]